MAGLVIGIDAGGSKTRALVAQADGKILGSGQAGPANYQSTGEAAALQALDQAVTGALSAAGVQANAVQALCLGAAGMDRPEDKTIFSRWAALAFPGARVALVNDARIVLATGTPDGWGLVVISGTGSIAYARSPQGQVMRSGGWGYLLGDEGSGYDIGLRALQAVMRASDGRGESTVLENAILTEWGLRRAEDLVRKVYGGLPRAEIARLSEIVERCAGAGDRVSTTILEGAGAELSAAAVAVVHRLGLISPVPAAFTGGVLVNGARIRQSLLREASEHGLVLEPVSLVTEPARGAVRLALEML